MHIDIDAHQVQDLANYWRQAPDLVAREMTGTTLGATLFLEREVKERTPVGATGSLRGSIRARRPERLSDNVIGVVGSSNPHAVPVELGTRPHFPPLEPLKDWVRSRLDIRGKSEVHAVALAIARKIAARGTPAAGMFHRGFNENRGTVAAMYERATQRIAEKLTRTS